LGFSGKAQRYRCYKQQAKFCDLHNFFGFNELNSGFWLDTAY
jgi:hypothetical protein